MKILVAVDGSKYTRRAVDYLISHREQFGGLPELTLVNVQYALPNHIAASLGKSMAGKFYADEWRKATALAKRLLDRAKIPYREANLIGEPGTVIAAQAAKGKFDLVVMGSHGHSSLANLVLGSCASKVLSLSKVPVLILR